MCALWKTCNQIMYHPQSGWFDEGPQRGPVMWRKGLKALHTRCCCVCGLTPSVPCRVTGDHGNLGMGTISCMQVVVHCECVFHLDLCTLERQSLCESHRQRRWLTRWSYSGFAPITGLLQDFEVRALRLGRAEEVTITPELLNGLGGEGHSLLVFPTEKPLMETAIGKGHRYLSIGPQYILCKILRQNYIKILL